MNAVVIPVVGIPQFELSVASSVITPEMKADINKIQVSENEQEPAMLSFIINIWDNRTNTLKEDYIDQFKIGTPVELALGINETTPIFAGEVTVLAPKFGGITGGDSLEVRAYNRLNRLQHGNRQRTFTDMTSSEIASEIADGLGLTAEVSDSADRETHVTQHKSDYEFLLRLANRLDFELSVEDTTLYFREKQESEGSVLSLTYRFDLSEFRITQRAVTAGTRVQVRGWDVQNKEPIIGEAVPGDETTRVGGNTSGAEASEEAFGESTMTYTDESIMTEDEAAQRAKALFNRQQENFTEAQGTCAGSPLLRAGKKIEILGIGDAFGGEYIVKSVTHTIDDKGYGTSFTLRRNSQ